MAQRTQPQSLLGSLFWPAMVLLCAGIAGLIFAFVFAELGGNGWRGGAGLGALVFLAAAFVLGNMLSGSLPPPNTLKAPTAPSGETTRARAASRDSRPAPAAPAPSAFAEPAAPPEAVVEPQAAPVAATAPDLPTSETAGISERVRDAAKAAGEAAKLMADPVATPPAGKVFPEQTVAATRPESLSSPRDGGPDDLKKIKGVGPKLEELLHSLGYYHFDQIAAWGAGEIAWVDSNLEGFNGRATRDDWVGQARLLAAGGTTEFASRVEKGDVYDED